MDLENYLKRARKAVLVTAKERSTLLHNLLLHALYLPRPPSMSSSFSPYYSLTISLSLFSSVCLSVCLSASPSLISLHLFSHLIQPLLSPTAWSFHCFIILFLFTDIRSEMTSSINIEHRARQQVLYTISSSISVFKQQIKDKDESQKRARAMMTAGNTEGVFMMLVRLNKTLKTFVVKMNKIIFDLFFSFSSSFSWIIFYWHEEHNWRPRICLLIHIVSFFLFVIQLHYHLHANNYLTEFDMLCLILFSTGRFYVSSTSSPSFISIYFPFFSSSSSFLSSSSSSFFPVLLLLPPLLLFSSSSSSSPTILFFFFLLSYYSLLLLLLLLFLLPHSPPLQLFLSLLVLDSTPDSSFHFLDYGRQRRWRFYRR